MADAAAAPVGTVRCYVGNLSWAVDDETLKAHMETVGTVVSSNVMRKGDGRSKGCAIVEFSTAAEAAKAKAELTDTELEGRKIFVREDKEPAGAFAAGPSKVASGTPGTSLYIGNLAWEVTWQDLKDLFTDKGVVYADVKFGRDGRSRGWGIARFETPEQAASVIAEFNETEYMGRKLAVREDKQG
eukprot:CAMPEP_0197610374 /NCGR_PEP_ID=MMETSP1326-20131121/53204_1 /TAXON_ID=1155430 /ORGANISM="Genus nov. species nov., Strain RCC2288" /LENGTH=185 /DNA_ID=CAMNT_0043178887 /DNA_START=53 /DNA_END=610 /DNA_ORIENTATION=+